MQARIASTLVLCMLVACSPVDDPSLFPAFDSETAGSIPEKLPTDYNPQRNVYFGDLHIHTGLSTGAWVQGVETRPDDAYTFARGGEIEHTAGYGIQLRKPLDFAAVTDHAEYLGYFLNSGQSHPLQERSLRERLLNDSRLGITWMIFQALGKRDLSQYDLSNWQHFAVSAWEETIAAANRHYLPGVFTAFVGYEWTSMPGGRACIAM